MFMMQCISFYTGMTQVQFFSPVNSEIDCPPLEDPVRGEVTFTTLTVDSTANYTCQAGYVINGASTRVCQSGGTWSGEEPMCNSELRLDREICGHGQRVGQIDW